MGYKACYNDFLRICICQSLRSPQMLTEADATKHKATQCYLMPSAVNHKNVSKTPVMKTRKLKCTYQQLMDTNKELNFPLSIGHKQYLKYFTSIFKALLYAKTTMMHMCKATQHTLDIHIYAQTNRNFIRLCLFFHSIFD